MQAKGTLSERAADAARRVAASAKSLSRFQLLALSLLGVLLAAGVSASYLNSRPRPVTVLRATGGSTERETGRVLTVHVAGAVVNPGLYRLDEGSRVADALEKAGGPTPDAAIDNINLAARLKDGEKIMVGSKSQTQATAGPFQPAGTSPQVLVNINTAGSIELESLPGVGPSLAARIIRYREENGQFASPDELDNVEGIGSRRLESLKGLVTI
jgi:competence protein ComEA